MWQNFKNWFQRKEAQSGGKLDRPIADANASKLYSPVVEMVETRSGRHVSPGHASTSGTPNSGRKTKKRKAGVDIPSLESSSSHQSRVEDDSTLVPSSQIGQDALVSKVEAGIKPPQTLPDRSRNAEPNGDPLIVESQPLQDSLDFGAETQSFPERNVEVKDALSHPAQPITFQPTRTTPFSTLNISTRHTPTEDLALKAGTKRRRDKLDATPVEEIKAMHKQKHKRFTSEEPKEVQELDEGGLVRTISVDFTSRDIDDKEHDDDSAPEEVTAAEGAEEAKLKAAKAAQAAKIQKDEEKAKRQKRDQKLKAQAKAAASHKKPTSPFGIFPEISITDSLLASTFQDDDDLPEELPDALLDLDPDELPKDEISMQPLRMNKRQRLDDDLRTPKDLRIGQSRIRILPQMEKSLPPPVVRQSADIKQAWLKARTQESKKKMSGYRTKGAGARSFLRSR